MGVYYYWLNHKLKIGILLGRSMPVSINNDDDIDELFSIKNDELFTDHLYDAVEELSLVQLTAKNLSDVIKGANAFSTLTMIDDKELYAYVLNKLLGKGEIISDDELDKYKDYKIYDDE